MTIWWLVLIVGSLAAVFLGFVWIIVDLDRLQNGARPGKKGGAKNVSELDSAYDQLAENEVEHLFNNEFREELRNRGRLKFENIINENAMFMKQDLDMTISQLNEYMKKQISAKLDSEFAEYAKAMKEAQELALTTLRKTTEEVEAQRAALADALQQGMAQREAALLKVYEANMAKVVEHYLLEALGEQLDLKSQLPYIIQQMEANKQAIAEDMHS